ncbi:hypothetical protein LUZ62_089810 [Rhynchospora pubera]|nr:hypothetical protein LUZ62_089810 [Rhynchospora pubera]
MAMAAPQVGGTPLDPHVIARAFVDQYYRILHRSPDQVYRFYQETSILSRPDVNGMMTSATTLQGINQKIMAMDVSNYFWEIETADAQPSYLSGVFIVVTGYLTGPDRIRRPFAQSFFLAPQENNGFFVLNDILRISVDRPAVVQAVNLVPVMANGSIHVPGNSAIHLQPNGVVPVQPNGAVPLQSNGNVPILSSDAVSVLANGTGSVETTQASLTTKSDAEVNYISETSEEDRVASVHLSNGDVNVRERAMNGFANGGSDKRDKICNGGAPAKFNKEEAKKQHVEEVAPSPQQDAPKKSYALIVMKGSPVSKPVDVAVKNTKVVETTEKPASMTVSAKQEPAPEATVANDINDSGSNNEVRGYSIFVKNLPVHVKADQLEEVYKKFGAIKPGGVQVRMSRFDHYWFGFVEFESIESMQAAIEAQPVTINGREVFCEEKRGSSRVVNGVHVQAQNGHGNTSSGPRGPPIRTNGNYRNDSYRGGRGPPVRGRGPRPMSGPPRYRDGYHPQHRSYQNSNGRPPSGPKGPSETPVAA